jgi:hypothetical protein
MSCQVCKGHCTMVRVSNICLIYFHDNAVPSFAELNSASSHICTDHAFWTSVFWDYSKGTSPNEVSFLCIGMLRKTRGKHDTGTGNQV